MSHSGEERATVDWIGRGRAPTPSGSVLADPDRLDAIARTGLLEDREATESLDRLTRLVAELLEVPSSTVSLVTTDRQVFASCVGLAEPYQSRREMPIEYSFCQHAVERDERLVIEDASLHPLVRENPAVSEHGVRSYAGVPLRTREGHVLGTLCAIDTEPRSWSEDDLRRLGDLAGAAESELQLRLDLAARREAERRLREREERLFEGNRAGIMTSRMDGTILEVNPAAAEIFGYPYPAALEGAQIQELYADPAERAGIVERLRSDGEVRDRELAMQAKDGSKVNILVNLAVHDDPREGELIIGSFLDLTRQKALEERLREQAFHDSLTGLANRRLLREKGEQSLEEARRTGMGVGLLYLDVSGFRRVNERLGHPFGDAILKQVAVRLQRDLRGSDVACRVGGDEFVVLIPQLAEAEAALTVAKRVQRAMEEPFEQEGEAVSLDVAIGAAVFPHHAGDLEELLQRADAALFGPDREKSPGIRMFDRELERDVPEMIRLAEEFTDALQNDELVLHYQPVVPAEGGAPVGVEALCRWNHPERGLLSAGEFVPVAESTGKVTSLDRWVAITGLRDQSMWTGELGWNGWLAVNVSTRSLAEPGLPERIQRILEETGTLEPSRLMLEITEHTAMREPEVVERILRLLDDDIGVGIAIDDFGTGYSSLRYLKRLPAHHLKVDMEFVGGIGKDAGDEKVIRGIVSLAHEFGMKVVAEGVETEAQATWLREVGCDYLQGYLIGRPVAGAELQLASESERDHGS